MSTDFFDEDLLDRDQEQAPAPAATGRSDKSRERSNLPEDDGAVSRASLDLNLTQMARQRARIDSDAANATEQLELLRRRQGDMEREKRELEDLRRMQDDYEQGKTEMLEKLNTAVVLFEKREIQTNRMAALYAEARARFKEHLVGLQGIDEETWMDSALHEELASALSLVESAKQDYNVAVSKIEAADQTESAPVQAAQAAAFEQLTDSRVLPGGFSSWLKVGFAATLPLLLCLVLLVVAVVVAKMSGVL